MILDAVEWVVGTIMSVFATLGRMELVPGVSLLSFLIGGVVISVIAYQLVNRAGGGKSDQ